MNKEDCKHPIAEWSHGVASLQPHYCVAWGRHQTPAAAGRCYDCHTLLWLQFFELDAEGRERPLTTREAREIAKANDVDGTKVLAKTSGATI